MCTVSSICLLLLLIGHDRVLLLFRMLIINSLYPVGIPRSEPPSCEAPRQPTIYALFNLLMDWDKKPGSGSGSQEIWQWTVGS